MVFEQETTTVKNWWPVIIYSWTGVYSGMLWIVIMTISKAHRLWFLKIHSTDDVSGYHECFFFLIDDAESTLN